MKMSRGAWCLAVWAFSGAAALAQPQPTLAPFTVMPALEGLRAGPVPPPVSVAIVVTGETGQGDEVQVLRLVLSGRGWPAWRIDTVAGGSAVESPLVLRGTPGEQALLVLVDARPGYRLDGPLRWPDRQDTRTIDARRRRTLLGSTPPASGIPSFTWVSAARLPEAGPWPFCGLMGARWECVGVPWDEPGVLLLSSGPPVRFAVAAVPEREPATVQLASVRASNWCRLLRLVSAATPWVPVGAMTAEPMRKRSRRPGRLTHAPDDRVTVDRLGPDAFWICGEAEPDDGVIHVEGEQVATTDLEYDGWHHGPPELPHEVMLDPAVPVTGRVEGANWKPAPGAVIVVSRVLPPGPRDDQAGSPPPQYVAEAVSGDDGAFEVPGLREGVYEFAALHPTLGRATKAVDLDGRPVVIRLAPVRRVRGRVLRDRQPAPGVVVGLAPDLRSYFSGADPMDLVSFSALTDDAGRFDVSVPPAGMAVLRIGTNDTGVVRVPLGPVDQLPAVSDLGDIELPSPVRLVVEVEGGRGCALSAAGPFGSSGLTVVQSVPDADGRHVFRLPEPGRWVLSLTCGGKDVPVVPPLVAVPSGEPEVYARVAVRIGG